MAKKKRARRIPPKKGLNPKQLRFVQEYLVDLIATQAAIRAGYSPKTAASQGERLLRHAEISAAVQKGMERRSQRTEITQDMVLRELGKIAFADIRKAVRWGRSPIDETSKNAAPNGLGIYPVELVPSEEIDDDTAAAVSEVSLTETGVKIKMHDKKGALVDIARHLGMFTEKVAHSGAIGVVDVNSLSRAQQDRFIAGESLASVLGNP